eukprot:Em0033g34a
MVYCFKLHVADVLAPGCDVSIGDSNVVDGADVNPPSAWKSQIDHSAVSTTGRGSAQSMYLPAIEGEHEANMAFHPFYSPTHRSPRRSYSPAHRSPRLGVVNVYVAGVVTSVLVNATGVVTGVLVNMSGVVTGVLVNKNG